MVIGITGKSGSGKSFLSEKLKEKLNAIHVDIDKISHGVLLEENTLKFVKTEFGEGVFDGNVLNRKKLGAIVFNDKQKREKLNNFCQTQMEIEIDEIIQKSNQTVILDYALLPWMKQFAECDIKILLTTSFDERYNRVNSRENISKEYFEKRDSSIKDYADFEFDITLDSTNDIDLNSLINTLNKFGGNNA
jgi:dephospho-CoA kinase